MKQKDKKAEHPVIRPVICSLAALLAGMPQVLAAPPPTSLSLPQTNQTPSTPNAPGASPLSGPLSAPLGAPLSAPLGAPQSAPQPAAPASSSSPSSGSKQEAKPAEKGSDKKPADQGSGGAGSLRAAYDAAFEATLDNPADPDVLVKFAELAVEFGDIEGAVSALERLLLIDDDQPEVKLELGVLYFRLGSKEAARMYLEAASKSSLASPETKERAEQYLKADGTK